MGLRNICVLSVTTALIACSPGTAPKTETAANDNRAATYALQQKCAKDARVFLREYGETTPTFTNHYNFNDGKCYVRWSTVPVGDTSILIKDQIYDVLENREIGESRRSDFNDDRRTASEMNGKKIESRAEWTKLADAYMTN